MTEQKPRATYKDLLEVPDTMVAEILDGELYGSPHPAMRHSRVSLVLGGRLLDPYDRGRGGPGGWWLLFEPEIHFSGDVLVPDLAGWRRDRWAEIPDTAATSQAPDWICEVLSGVEHAWLINPMARTLEVLRRADRAWALLATHGGDELVRAEPFEAVAVELAELWGEV